MQNDEWTPPEDRTSCPGAVPGFHSWKRGHKMGRLWSCRNCRAGIMAPKDHDHLYLHDPNGTLKCVYCGEPGYAAR